MTATVAVTGVNCAPPRCRITRVGPAGLEHASSANRQLASVDWATSDATAATGHVVYATSSAVAVAVLVAVPVVVAGLLRGRRAPANTASVTTTAQ